MKSRFESQQKKIQSFLFFLKDENDSAEQTLILQVILQLIIEVLNKYMIISFFFYAINLFLFACLFN